MKFTTLILGGVAGMALLGATPGFAQYAGNPPQVSTPAEQQQTQQLNQQNTDGTSEAPAALNGQAARGTPSQSQTQYDQQQQQYQNQQDSYHAQRAQYDHDLRRYDVAEYAWTDYPARPYGYRFRGDAELVPVDTLDRRQLSYTPVEGPDGRWVGRVRSVRVNTAGQPIHIEIALNRHASVFVNSANLLYDPRDRVIFTDLTRDQLWSMPGEDVVTEMDHP
jgi:hypothetical protein